MASFGGFLGPLRLGYVFPTFFLLLRGFKAFPLPVAEWLLEELPGVA